MRIVIDYDQDPDFSFIVDESTPDRSEEDYVALETLIYRDDDMYGIPLTSLSNSVFNRDDNDWVTGVFNSVEDIPERCQHLREVAGDLLREAQSVEIQRHGDMLIRLLDPRGVTVEVISCTLDEATTKAAEFIRAQAGEGLAGSIEFTGAGLSRSRPPRHRE
jgi:hypothetical protein